MIEVEWGGRVDIQWSPASPPLAATSPSTLPSSRLTYGPHCWSTSAPLCTRTGMASWCWFMAARLRTGRSWLSLQLGSAPCHVGKGTNSHKSLCAVAPACPPSSKSLTEVNCLAQERGAGSPGPVLKTELPRHMGDGLQFLSLPPPPPTQQEAPPERPLCFFRRQEARTGSQSTGSVPEPASYWGSCALFSLFFFFL